MAATGPTGRPGVGGTIAGRSWPRRALAGRVLRGAVLLAFAAVVAFLPLSFAWILPLLAVVTMTSGIALGPLPAFLIAIGASLFTLFVRRPASPDIALASLLVPLFAVAVGGAIGLALRRVSRAAEQSARRAHLLSQALLRLPALDHPDQIYRELLLWLQDILGFTHADILVQVDSEHMRVHSALGWTPPSGITLPLQSITGRALRTGRVQHVPDTQADPEFVQGVGIDATHSELALPIKVSEQIHAVLNIERSRTGAFLQDEISTLEALVLAVGDAIERLGQLEATNQTSRQQDFLLDFSRQVTQQGTPQGVAQRALQLLLPFAGADVGLIWLPGGRAHLLAGQGMGDFQPPDVPSPLVAGLKGQAPTEAMWVPLSLTSPYSTARQLESGLQSFAILPLLQPDGRPQAVLELLYYRSPAAFGQGQREVLRRAADRLHIALQGVLATSRLADLLAALHALGAVEDIQELCDHALAAAVRLVPGADAATLWLSDSAQLELRSALGYAEAGPPPHWSMRTLEDALAWYGGDEDGFRRGLPRIRATDVVRGSLPPDAAWPVASIAAPLVLNGHLVGLICIDSLAQPDAFSQEALSLAGMFGLHLAVLLSQGRHRSVLAAAARTDTLTGIGNRRNFDERIAAEWKESRRYSQPLSLVILDLQGFKAINDRYGHLAGDEALTVVAKTLNAIRRDGDTVFRWGGDEFAILLTHANLAQALQAASRYLDELRSVAVLIRDGREVRVGGRLGIASAPEDADSIEGLVRVADERVIMAKRLGQGLSPAGPTRS